MRQIDADREHARICGPGTFHRDLPRNRLRIAWVNQPGPIALEDRQERIQHIAHHLIQIVRTLHRPIDLIQASQESKVGQVLLFRPLYLGDIVSDAEHADHVPGGIFLRHLTNLEDTLTRL